MNANKPIIAASLVAVMVAFAAPAEAGRWVNGGMFDPNRGVSVAFLRFLAGDNEGQMTIRCDALDGLWVDAGVAGNGELPPGFAVGDEIVATFAFEAGGDVETVAARGQILIRGDGAVLVSITGDQSAALGTALLQPAERLHITIGDLTAPIGLDGLSERAVNLADRCGAWPTGASTTNITNKK